MASDRDATLRPPVRVGLPLWGFKAWVGGLYRAGSRSNELLAQYARAFDCVEGNTTFYSAPTPSTVARWRDDTPPEFRFCFKFPRALTHERGLVGAGRLGRAFVETLRPLEPRLGPFMLQLPSSWGPADLEHLDRFLGELPAGTRCAVELRHPSFFREGAHAERAAAILARRACSWVHLDTRGLRSGPQSHPDIVAARHPKPDLPVLTERAGPHPIVRFIGHPQNEHNLPWLDAWARTLRDWHGRGARPYLFVHCPNDLHAPGIARAAQRALARQVPMPAPPAWPGELEATQLSLL